MQTQVKKKILITGVGGPAGVNISRLLKTKENIQVIGCDIDELAAGRFFTDEFFISPRVSDTKAYRDWLTKTVSEQEIDLLIPTVDEELLPLSKFVSELSSQVILSNTSTLEITSDKFNSYQFIAERLPELCPQFSRLEEWSPKKWSREEYFIKPCHGRGARGCRQVTQSELSSLQRHSNEVKNIIVMEMLPGTEWTVDAYVAKDGSVPYLVPRERLGLSGGISVKGKTVKHQGVIDATKQLLNELPIQGPACIQWKQAADGTLKFIEVNPRLSGGLMITAAAGADPADALIAELEGEVPKEQSWEEKTVVGYFTYQEVKNN